jgi:hypothetical protein
MRRLSLIVVLALVVAVPHLAAQEDLPFGSVYSPGNVSVSGSVGFGYGLSLALYPGAELILAQPALADEVPLAIGVAARGYWNRYTWSGFGFDYGWTSFGAGGFATVHLALTGVEGIAGDYLNRTDFYAGLGLAYSILTYDSTVPEAEQFAEGGIYFASIGGVNYFLTDNFAVMLEGNYWGYYGGGLIGLLFKL